MTSQSKKEPVRGGAIGNILISPSSMNQFPASSSRSVGKNSNCIFQIFRIFSTLRTLQRAKIKHLLNISNETASQPCQKYFEPDFEQTRQEVLQCPFFSPKFFFFLLCGLTKAASREASKCYIQLCTGLLSFFINTTTMQCKRSRSEDKNTNFGE